MDDIRDLHANQAPVALADRLASTGTLRPTKMEIIAWLMCRSADVVPGKVRRFRRRARAIHGALAIVLLLVPIAILPPGAAATLTTTSTRCWWTSQAAAATYTPNELAEQVLKHMTLVEKIDEVGLANTALYENENAGIPGLCIPPLTLQDGPNGIATGDTGVTQLPASIGVAATFDPSLAYAYGRVIGSEARGQGIAAVQGPNLNLARLPNSGRIYEGYGEDPELVSAMGVADIKGIQSEGVMAEAKHFTAYTQETARISLNQVVSPQALEEVYLTPFKAAVQQAHVAALMCAYGKINDVAMCADEPLFKIARAWGFTGFVRSDMAAVNHPIAAFDAGLDMIKPAVPDVLLAAVRGGEIPLSRLNSAVLSILTAMFAHGLVEHQGAGRTDTRVWTSAHVAVALTAADQSIVLLKNANKILPLDRTTLHSVAVIGPDAGAGSMTAGYGGARVVAPFIISPLNEIRRWLRANAIVSFSPGGPRIGAAAASSRKASVGLAPSNRPGVVTPEITTAIAPGVGPGWEHWSETIDPSSSGLYDFALQTEGDTWAYLNGRVIFAEPGLHGPATWSTSVALIRGTHYLITARWFESVGASLQRTGVPRLSWTNVSPMIANAVEAARRASVAIVFASDFNEEGFDRPTLSLPSDSNALIFAVAKANPRTIVVLNTGGAVLMPWLSKVAGVLEAWYPGEEDGAATVAVLSGTVDPSGHLPVTFPRSDAASPMAASSSWPGLDGNVFFGGLDIGYRYFDKNRISPMFPFGFGLSYTTFTLADPVAVASGDGAKVTLQVTNTGARRGRVVVQAYLSYPPSVHEAPRELKAFSSAWLDRGTTRTLTLALPASAFEVYRHNHFTIPTGRFIVSIGQSERDLPLKLQVIGSGPGKALAGA